MRACLSERRLSTTIKQYENLPESTTISEITELLPVYAPKFFQYVGQFGVHYQGLVAGSNVGVDVGTFQFSLAPVHDDESRNTRIQGIQMLDAVWVALGQDDLPAFYIGPVRTCVEDAFGTFQGELSRIVPAQLDSVLQRIGEKAFSAPAPAEYSNGLSHEESFESWMRRSGLKDPAANSRKVDEYNQAEIARVKAAQDAAYNRFVNGE